MIDMSDDGEVAGEFDGHGKEFVSVQLLGWARAESRFFRLGGMNRMAVFLWGRIFSILVLCLGGL